MDRRESTQRSTEILEKESKESIQRIRRDLERLAEWITAHSQRNSREESSTD